MSISFQHRCLSSRSARSPAALTAFLVALAVSVTTPLAGCGEGTGPVPRAPEHLLLPQAPGERPAAEPRTVAPVAVEDDGEWHMAAKDHANTRFSGLDEITTANVRNLTLAWSFETGQIRGHEAAPLVVGDTMYVVTPFPNTLFALDLREPAGRVRWRYDPEPTPAAQGVACCDVVNRGAAYADGRIFFNTLDVHTVAVDADTGEELWRTRLGDISRGETMTMAPLVVGNLVLVGNSGGEFGVRGWLTALDTATGELAWRAYSTGPDDEVLIGDDFEPFYEHDRGRDLGVQTWPPDTWRIGGGTVWGWISYDPDLNLIYYGTGNPGPWNPDQRPGDNKWTSGVFARDPATGRARWAYQWSPHDKYDHDGNNELVLLDLPLGPGGELRRVLVRPERNGFVYVMDRATGEVLSADPFVPNTVIRRVDLESGRPEYVDGMSPGFGRTIRNICPAAPGGKDWQPSAWSPRTGLLYIPHQNICMDMAGVEANYIAGTPFLGARTVMYPGPGGHLGEFTAWDPVARRAAWKIVEPFPVWSGALTTSGDVVFYGTLDRKFKAVDARTGDLLWQYEVESGIVGQPVTYRGPDGRQYVAILAGVGGWPGVLVAAGLDPRDQTGALGFVNAMRGLSEHTGVGGRLYVFALPGDAPQ